MRESWKLVSVHVARGTLGARGKTRAPRPACSGSGGSPTAPVQLPAVSFGPACSCRRRRTGCLLGDRLCSRLWAEGLRTPPHVVVFDGARWPGGGLLGVRRGKLLVGPRRRSEDHWVRAYGGVLYVWHVVAMASRRNGVRSAVVGTRGYWFLSWRSKAVTKLLAGSVRNAVRR